MYVAWGGEKIVKKLGRQEARKGGGLLEGGPGKKTGKGRSVGLGKGHFFLQRTKKEDKK